MYCINVLVYIESFFSFFLQRLVEKQTSFDKQLDSLTDLLSEMETRGPFNPKVQSLAFTVKYKGCEDTVGVLQEAERVENTSRV